MRKGYLQFIAFFGTLLLIGGCLSGNNQKKDLNSDDYMEEVDQSEPTNYTRDIWQQPERVIDMLGDISDKTVADLGTGSGYFALRLLDKAEKVIAIDIDRASIAYLDTMKANYLPDEFKDKLELRLAEPNDPNLKYNEVDAVIVANTYLYIQNRVEYFSEFSNYMKPGGILLVTDFKKKKLPFGPPDYQKVALNVVEKELIAAGYDIIRSDDQTLDYQYILLAVNAGK